MGASLLVVAILALTLAGYQPMAPRPSVSPAPSGDVAVAPSASPRSTLPPATTAPSPTSSPSPAQPSASPVLLPASTTPVTVPILYYHRVQAVPNAFASWSKARRDRWLRYDTLPKAFEAQLDWLVVNGYTTILPRDLAAHWDEGAPLPPKPVILTFDDGDRTWVRTVLPALAQRGMVAEFYLTLDAIRKRAIDWPEVQALARAGNGIGAHGVHHHQLAGVPGKSPVPADVRWREVHDIRAIIEAHVGVAPDSMAYVGGGYDRALMSQVQQAGYTTARSIIRGVVQAKAHRYDLRVVRIGAHDDVVDPVEQTLVDGLPTFEARMAGASDKRH